MADEKVDTPAASAAGTVWVWSPTGGVTGHNWDEMSPEQREQVAGRLRSGELRRASGPDDKPAAPDEVPEVRIARAAVPQPAGSPMAPRQGLDPDKAEAQGLDPLASDQVKAEHAALVELGPDASSIEKLEAQNAAASEARTEALGGSGLRDTARGRKTAAAKQ